MRNQSPTDKHVYLSEDQVSVAEAAGAVTRAACLPGAPLQQVGKINPILDPRKNHRKFFLYPRFQSFCLEQEIESREYREGQKSIYETGCNLFCL